MAGLNVWVLDAQTSATRLTGYPDPLPDGSGPHAVGGDDQAGSEWPVMRRR